MRASFRMDDLPATGNAMHQWMTDLYPLCRSITGEGLRASLRQIGDWIPLTIHEVPTGTQVFDWTIPKEWNVRTAYVKNSRGEKVIDFARCNLHLLNYSLPMQQRMALTELKAHLFSLPEQPDLVPYRTAYYHETWGFCVSHNLLESLPEDEYEVYIDSSLEAGYLSYGECYLPGETEDEILISCHCCHPSLANDNLSGMALS
ncbi:MAG: DUF4910 domain-containing protein, partial [Chloroflexota bacterium]|nr:DUF4910 domain-containing protein [Chloroflexota bacterium]